MLRLHQHGIVCIRICKVLFEYCFAFMHLLVSSVHTCDQCTGQQHGVFTASVFVSRCCLRAFRERGEGGIGVSGRGSAVVAGERGGCI